MALAMFSTAMRMKPSATSSALRPSPISAASSAKALRTAASSSGLSWLGPKILGKLAARSLPTMTLASVTVSGPPRR